MATEERPQCHCASVVALPDGSLFAAWFAGAFETAPDQAILGATLPAGEERWSAPRELVDTPDRADGQPVPWLAPDGKLWLFFVTLDGVDWTSARLLRRVSPDMGRTWGESMPIVEEPGWMVRSRSLLARDGAILLPAYEERTRRSAVLRSNDGGEHWVRGAAIATPAGNIHPTLLRRRDGALDAYLRSRGRMWRATSDDDGRTWAPAEPTPIPNPDSGFDVIRTRDGALVLAYDDSDSLRTPLRLARSTDEGASWEPLATLEDELAEFSYPVLAEDGAGRVHCLYTARRTEIREATVDLREATVDLRGTGR
ncbi:MAG: exo-alpha-sialidase [Acidimicrobiales bacterium]|nr:exo-alpha-sialidase [Acidimicrobiales bacterium]